MRPIIALLAVSFLFINSLVFASDFDEFEAEYAQEKLVINDPFYRYNKSVYELNRALYNMSIRPLAGVYNAMLPSYARKGVSNFFANLSAPARALTLLLRVKPKEAAQTFGGFIMNSIAGVGGLLEIAPHGASSDFGLVAASWGAKSIAHLQLPILGPSNVRDALFKPLDWAINPISYLGVKESLAASSIEAIANHSALIEQNLDSLNGYVLLRDFYEKYRKDLE